MTAGCRLDIALPPAISIADTPQKAHCPRKCIIARRVVEIPAALTVAAWAVCCLPIAAQTASASARSAVLKSDGIQFRMELAGGRYGFDADGSTVVAADPEAGVLLAGRPVNLRPDGPCANTECHLAGATAVGEYMRLTVKLAPHRAELIAEPQRHGEEVRFVTGGAEPAFGLADHAVLMNFSTLAHKQYNTDVSGFADDQFLSGQGLARLVSNFVIYPRQRFAEILLDPTMKIVHTSEKQIVQGVVHAGPSERLFYFFGNPHEIYAQYLDLRNETGYRVFMPKYQAFGVGWEAFGALGWNTNQNTVEASVDRYIAAGYPLRWIVIGSGFWPAAPAMSIWP